MQRWVNLVLLCALSAYLFFFGLGKMALTDPDEPFYAQTAKEMLNRGEWLTPRIFGEPQFEKPVLYYWLIIGSYKIFGINEFAARFPSALFGILGIIGIYFLGRTLFSEKTAVYSALVMATSVEYAVLARGCVTDMVLCVFILYGFLFFIKWLQKSNDGPAKGYFVMSAAALGLAVLTKGPVGLVLPAGIIFLFLAVTGRLKSILRMPFVEGVAVFFIVAAPWYYLMIKTYGADFSGHFFGFQNVTRFMHPEHKSGDIFYYYIPILIGGFFPWSLYLPCGLRYLTVQDRDRRRAHIFLLIWVLVFFVFFSLSRTKLPTYIFPLFPALALVIGRYIELVSKDIEKKKSYLISGGFFILSLIAALVTLFLISVRKYPQMNADLLKITPSVIVLAAVSVYLLIKRSKLEFFGMVMATMSFIIVMGFWAFADVVTVYESSRPEAMEINKLIKNGEKVGAETDYRRGIAFYTNREDVLDIHSHDASTKFFESKDRVWGVLKNKNHVQLYTDSLAPYKDPTYVVGKWGKRVLITNIPPEDGAYLKKRAFDDFE